MEPVWKFFRCAEKGLFGFAAGVFIGMFTGSPIIAAGAGVYFGLVLFGVAWWVFSQRP